MDADSIPIRPEVLLANEAFVRRVARSLVRDAAVDDVVQETWLAALTAPPRNSEALLAWLRRTAHNVALKLARGDARRAEREQRVAHAEALAPTDEIVQRLELERRVVEAVLRLDGPAREAILLRFFEELPPREIAARLAVPVNTVQARIRRAQERLRHDLGSRPWSDRKRWVGGFAAAAGLKLAPASSAPGWIAVWLLMKTQLVVASVAVLAAGGAFLWLEYGDSPARPAALDLALAALAEPQAAAPASPADLAAPTAHPDGASPSVATDPAAGRTPVAAAPEEPVAPAPGRLVLHSVDERTGVPLRSHTVLLASATRFAELGDGPHLDAWLTPGVWDGTIRSPGYEPYTLQGVAIGSGETVDLGTVALEPGSGRIEGAVRMPGAADDAIAFVELAGDARHPCPACAAPEPDAGADADQRNPFARDTPCPACGYMTGRSVRAVLPGESYAFANLASGNYVLRVLGRDGQAYAREQRVALKPRGRLWLDLDTEAPLDLDFHLTWEDGAMFDGRWEENGEEKREDIVFRFRRGDVEVAHATYQGQSRFVRLQLADGATIEGLAFASRALTVQETRTDALLNVNRKAVAGAYTTLTTARLDNFVNDFAIFGPRPMDRERVVDDTLWPTQGWPVFEAGGLSLTRIEEGAFRIGPLLCEGITVQAECGLFRSERARLDSGACAGGDTLLVMHPVPPEPKPMAARELTRIWSEPREQALDAFAIDGQPIELGLALDALKQD